MERRKGGCLRVIAEIFFLWLTGTIAYNIVEPHSFFGVILFLVFWPIMMVISMFIIMLAISLLGKIVSDK